MSTTARFAFRAAVYLLLVREGHVLLARRFNTGWSDGDYTLPAGHIDGDEPATVAMSREAHEELGITVAPEALRFFHVMHQRSAAAEYIDFYFTADDWDGEPAIMEPDKCDDLRWFPLDALPDNLIPNVRQALAAHADGLGYSEFGWHA